jgi:hypothetical protein
MVAAVILLGSTPASAQQHEGFGVQIGGGPVFSNLTDTKGLNTDNKTGYLVGLLMGGNRGGRVGVEADVLYGEKGAKSGSDEFKVKVVDVPVMLKLNVGSGNVNSYSIFAQGGGFFDWQFSGKVNDTDLTDTNGFEVGYVLGGGVEFARVSVQARYYRGVRQIKKEFDVANSDGVKTQAFAVLFAFRLN